MDIKIIILALSLIGFTKASDIPLKPKVINGTDADISEFGFIASLRRNGRHNCGSTILSKWWILTAAHCVGAPVEQYSVQYANTMISEDGSNVIAAEQIIIHEAYNSSNQWINDIALVKLKEPLENPLSNGYAKLPVELAYFTTGTPVVLAGWGTNVTGGAGMPILQKANLQVFSAWDCDQLHTSTVHYTNICGGIPEGWRGQCSGDSGGPLIVDGIQVGIVSWSRRPCTVPPYPGVYTGVSHYISWISENTGITFRLGQFLKAESSSSSSSSERDI